jgi:hypothetical protein
MAWLDLRKTDRDRESTLRDSRISAIDLREWAWSCVSITKKWGKARFFQGLCPNKCVFRGQETVNYICPRFVSNNWQWAVLQHCEDIANSESIKGYWYKVWQTLSPQIENLIKQLYQTTTQLGRFIFLIIINNLYWGSQLHWEVIYRGVL